jgi:hypothetical protein
MSKKVDARSIYVKRSTFLLSTNVCISFRHTSFSLSQRANRCVTKQLIANLDVRGEFKFRSINYLVFGTMMFRKRLFH